MIILSSASVYASSKSVIVISSTHSSPVKARHYSDVIMGSIASQITSLTIVYSNVYSGADQRKHQCSASLAFVRVIHRRPVNSLHKGPVTRKLFPFDDVIMKCGLFSGTNIWPLVYLSFNSVVCNVILWLTMYWFIYMMDKHKDISLQRILIQVYSY